MDTSEVPVNRVTLPAWRNEHLIALVLIALFLRAIPWLANLPLHHDEALYGTWARAIADGSDPLLLGPWVDKPPLGLYLLALGINLFGASELALRVPGMFAGVLTVLATFGLGQHIAGRRVAAVAAVLVALSPFAILFAPTAFTDGWLTLFLVLAAWAALARRPGWAGVLLGLACASKQQGLMGVPLVAALVVAGVLERRGAKASEGAKAPASWRGEARGVLGAVGLAVLGFAVVFGAVMYWDSLRWHNRPSYWDQSLRTYGGVVLAPLAEWPERAAEWARQAGYWFGAWPLTALLIAVALAGSRIGRHMHEPQKDRAESHSAMCPWLLLAYILGYLLVHLLFTFQTWDRYLLPILPLVCVLLGEGLLAGWDALRENVVARRWAAGALAAGLLYAACLGLTASIPVGSDIGAYRGVAEAARFIASQPPGTTVYFDRIGWHLGYYLYGLPVTRSWYDSPQKLAREAVRVAAEHPHTAQWLALPGWEQDRLPSLEGALEADGLTIRPAVEVVEPGKRPDLTLYRVERATLVAGPVQEGRDNMGAQP